MSIANIAASLAGGAVTGLALDDKMKKLPGAKLAKIATGGLAGQLVSGMTDGAAGAAAGVAGESMADAQRAKAKSDADEFKSAWDEGDEATMKA